MSSHTSRSTLIEIRLRRADKIDEEVNMTPLALWHPDTPDHRERLAAAVEKGNRLFGAHSHWIEKRQA